MWWADPSYICTSQCRVCDHVALTCFSSLLSSADLSQLCDVDEDHTYVTEKVEKLISTYEALQKELRERLSLLEMRQKSWEHFPVEEAIQVQQEESVGQMCVCLFRGEEIVQSIQL